MASRKCIFCDGTPVTREDALPLWLIEVLYPDGQPAANQYQTDFLDWTDRGEGAIDQRPNIRKRVVKRVCEECNGGWMEDDHPFVRKLVLGESVHLGEGEQLAVARWAVKTTMMMEFTGVRQATSVKHHHWLYEQRTPPPGTGVWIVRNPSVADSAWYERPLIQSILMRDMYGSPINNLMVKRYVTVGGLGFGSLFLLAVMTDHPSVKVGKYVRSDLLRIWPFAQPLDFPCGPVVTSDELFEIAHVGVRIQHNVAGDAVPPPPPGTYSS
jgi:hypothetical protein